MRRNRVFRFLYNLGFLFIFLLNCGRQSGFVLQSLSLRVLQQNLAVQQNDNTLDEQISHLGGITQLLGIVEDSENSDLIIYGIKDKKRPPLELMDFVVALRNAYLQYARVAGDTIYYSSPACDIRPIAATVKKMQGLTPKLFLKSSARQIEDKLSDWKCLCESPQEVSVFGVPFHSHFARVMVHADYMMKSIADGTEELNLPGLNSHMGLCLDHLRYEISKGQEILKPFSAMNRFWLLPDSNNFEEDDGIVLIKQSPVKVGTQPIKANSMGELIDAGGQDPYATEFADNLSSLYDKVSELRPVYLELENLFHLTAIAKIIHKKQADVLANLDMTFLLDSFNVAIDSVDRQVPGRYAVKYFEHIQKSDTLKHWLPSCGGVDISIEASDAQFHHDASGLLAELKNNILGSRPSGRSLTWQTCASSAITDAPHLANINRHNKTVSTILVTIDKGEYLFKNDNLGEFYRGLDLREPINQLNVHHYINKNILEYCFQLYNFSPDQEKAFELELSRQIAITKPNVKFCFLPNDKLLKPGTRIKNSPNSTEYIREGPDMGSFSAEAQFEVSYGGKNETIEVNFSSRFERAINAICRRIRDDFSISNNLNLSPLDYFNRARFEVMRDLELDPQELKILIKEQIYNYHSCENIALREIAKA